VRVVHAVGHRADRRVGQVARRHLGAVLRCQRPEALRDPLPASLAVVGRGGGAEVAQGDALVGQRAVHPLERRHGELVRRERVDVAVDQQTVGLLEWRQRAVHRRRARGLGEHRRLVPEPRARGRGGDRGAGAPEAQDDDQQQGGARDRR